MFLYLGLKKKRDRKQAETLLQNRQKPIPNKILGRFHLKGEDIYGLRDFIAHISFDLF